MLATSGDHGLEFMALASPITQPSIDESKAATCNVRHQTIQGMY